MNELSFPNLDPNTRIAVRALIIKNDHVLVQHKRYEDGSERFVLPGGAPFVTETLEQGLLRECHEEIGTHVTLLKLHSIADFFKPRDTEPPSTRHQIEIIFSCTVEESYQADNGPRPDKHQIDVIWLEKDKIKQKLWPKKMAALIFQEPSVETAYLGVID